MSPSSRRIAAMSGAGALVMSGIAAGGIDIASAQGANDSSSLPEIVVNAPSPIVHRNRARHRAASRVRAPAPAAETAAAPPPPELPGTLPVVTDQFATVTVVPLREIPGRIAKACAQPIRNAASQPGSSRWARGMV